MGKASSKTPASSGANTKVVYLVLMLLGGFAWLTLATVPRFAVLLKNVTDSGPITVGVDLMADVVSPGHLLSAGMMAGIANFGLGAVLLITVIRFIATSFRDQVFTNIGLRATSLGDRIRARTSNRIAAGAAKLANSRIRPGLKWGVTTIQRRLETAVALTSKNLRVPGLPGEPSTDPQVSLRIARDLRALPGHDLAENRQPLISSFRSDLDKAEKELSAGRDRLVQAYREYDDRERKRHLRRQIKGARRRKALAAQELSVAVRCKIEPPDGVDRITAVRKHRAEQDLTRVQNKYPAAAKFEAAEIELFRLERALVQEPDLRVHLATRIRFEVSAVATTKATEKQARQILNVATSCSKQTRHR